MAIEQATVEPDVFPAPNAARSLTAVHWFALGLAAVTGAIHLYLYVTDSWLPFLLAGVGFFGAVGLFLALPRFRRLVYVAGVPFTAAQVAAYLQFPMGPLGLAVLDKVVQVALILALGYLFVVDGRRARSFEPDPGASVAADPGPSTGGDRP